MHILKTSVFFQIIHRDLAARNVLVGEGEKCKVTDFGMARNVHQDDIYTRKSRVSKLGVYLSRPGILPSRVDKFLSIIALLISELDSRPVSFFRLSMKVKYLLPRFVVPQHNFGCLFLSGLRFSNEPLRFFQIVLVALHKVLCL